MSTWFKDFVSGIGSVLDIWPSAPPLVSKPAFMRVSERDRLAADWKQVGHHLARARRSATETADEHAQGK